MASYFPIVLFPVQPLTIRLAPGSSLVSESFGKGWRGDLISSLCPSLTLLTLTEKVRQCHVQAPVLPEMLLIFPEAALTLLSSYLFLQPSLC